MSTLPPSQPTRIGPWHRGLRGAPQLGGDRLLSAQRRTGPRAGRTVGSTATRTQCARVGRRIRPHIRPVRLGRNTELGCSRCLVHLLAGHQPYPAVVLDRWFDVMLSNRAIGALLGGVDPTCLPRRSTFTGSACTPTGGHPDPQPHRVDRPPRPTPSSPGLTHRRRATRDSGLAEVRTYYGFAAALDDYREPVATELLLTLHLAHTQAAICGYTAPSPASAAPRTSPFRS